MRVPTTLLLVLVTFIAKASAADDIYWEGEDDLANEFLEVDRDAGIGGHLRRLKRGFLDWWKTESTEAPESEDVTEDDDLNEDEDNFEIDSNGSGALEPELDSELKEKTLRVTFVVKEPYHGKYSNRDSPQFQNFSRSLAEAVNNVFRDLPGTHRASLVRIQSRPADEFSCKVTLDIIVTGDDTKRTSDTLRDYIRTKRVLGNIQVDDEDYTDTVLPTGVDNETIDSYNEPEPERGDANPEFFDTTTSPDIVQPNEDNIYGERPIGVEGEETTEEIRPDEGEYTPFFGRPDEQRPDGEWPNGASPDDRRPDYGGTTEGRPDYGRPEYGRPEYESTRRPDEGRKQYGRPEYESTGRPDEGRNQYGRPDYESTGRPDEGRNQYGRPEYESTERPDEGRNQYGRPEYESTRRPDEGRNQYGRPEYESTGRPDEGRNQYGRPDYESTGRTDEGRNQYGRPDYESTRRPDEGNQYGRPNYEITTEQPGYGGQGENAPYPGSTNTCPDGDIKCDYTRCVPSYQRCDGRRDCDDGADEAGCPDREYLLII